ncbi:MAG: pyruvate kinase [Clostridia bacterium]
MRKTKIICTIGPACDSYESITELIKCGMNVARLNMSHGDFEYYIKVIERVKDARAELKLPVAIMLDTKGPEIRIRKFENNQVELVTGKEFTITSRDIIGNNHIVSVSYKKLPKIVQVGTRLLLNDGLIELKVKNIEDTDILCKIVEGGILSNNKSINIPDTDKQMNYLGDVDKLDIMFACAQDIDYLALSFVSSAQDVIDVRNLLKKQNAESIKIIAKIENQKGKDNINEIVKVCDGIMVARGSLGVEIDIAKLPSTQKQIIKLCNEQGKIVVTATEMLESMIKNPRPTRAEISDVANAVFDGTSAVMLSGETASGLYPFKAIKTMSNIAEECEKDYDNQIISHSSILALKDEGISKSMGYAASALSDSLSAKAITVVTYGGRTANFVSMFKPKAPIIATTPRFKIYNQLALVWGVYPLFDKIYPDTDTLLESATKLAIQSKIIKSGDLIVQTAGVPVGQSTETNLLKVRKA